MKAKIRSGRKHQPFITNAIVRDVRLTDIADTIPTFCLMWDQVWIGKVKTPYFGSFLVYAPSEFSDTWYK